MRLENEHQQLLTSQRRNTNQYVPLAGVHSTSHAVFQNKISTESGQPVEDNYHFTGNSEDRDSNTTMGMQSEKPRVWGRKPT